MIPPRIVGSFSPNWETKGRAATSASETHARARARALARRQRINIHTRDAHESPLASISSLAIDMPQTCTVESPALDIEASELWRARTTEDFMACEREVFNDVASAIVLYERRDHEAGASSTARYVVRTRTRVTMPYLARKALGSRSGASVDVFDDYVVDEIQGTAPFLYEACLRSYTTHLSPSNSVIRGVVRCKSVDGGARCELAVRVECSVKASGLFGSAIERAMIGTMREKLHAYPRVVELYKTRRALVETRRAARALARAKFAEGEEFHSVINTSDDESAYESDIGGDAALRRHGNAETSRIGDSTADAPDSVTVTADAGRACCVPRRGSKIRKIP